MSCNYFATQSCKKMYVYESVDNFHVKKDLCRMLEYTQSVLFKSQLLKCNNNSGFFENS